MKRFLKVWSVIVIVVGCMEAFPLIAGGDNLHTGRAVAIGIPMIVEGICVLSYMKRKQEPEKPSPAV